MAAALDNDNVWGHVIVHHLCEYEHFSLKH